MKKTIGGLLTLCATIFALATQFAYGTDSNLALNLGTVLGSEAYCDLAFDQTAIQAFIEKNVSPNDMSFPSELSMMTGGTEAENKDMTASEKTARCTQVRRIAKSYGFVR